ncbi:alkaline-phosphatase-like protein [Geopyxis carbonaria]|nr:alkaline-phosphatase-like protein [Geopyxis carbonaria]
MRHPLPWLLIAALNALLPIGILIFAKGFFPYKPYLNGLATFPTGHAPAPPLFDKLVFMVVDALRSDFVFSENSSFQFTQKLISNGSARPFTAHATSPTITMPRVKAITTGSVPGFLDVILNFAESDTSSTLAQQDTWLAQMKVRGGNLVMYGDDTWLKLFPGSFLRSDGTSSFFVADFTEVDNNVTRHIGRELVNDDWDVMILHYLGLDHIGHKSGPRSKHMRPKQQEMDLMVERIYTAIETKDHLQSTLFVLLGDHGMNDAGNHGGSGPGETSPALVFMSPKFQNLPGKVDCPTEPNSNHGFDFYSTVEQSDIAPTLSGLLGIPIPKNNLGVFIPQLLHFWDEKDRVQIMMNNARQLFSVVSAAYPSFGKDIGNCVDSSSEIEELKCLWSKSYDYYEDWEIGKSSSNSLVINSLQQFSFGCQKLLSGVASNYDIKWMVSGIVMMIITGTTATIMLIPIMRDSLLVAFVCPILTVGYGGMMFASSYVEEEHHFWYWIASGWFMLLFFREQKHRRQGLGPLLILFILRVARRWNQTGQKYAGAPDIAKTYFPRHTTLLWILIIVTYLENFLRMYKRGFRRLEKGPIPMVFAFTATLAGLIFKISFAAQDSPELIPEWLDPILNSMQGVHLINQAQAVFGILFAGIIYTFIFEIGHASIMDVKQNAALVLGAFIDLFLMTQTRFINLPVFLLFRAITRLLLSLASLSSSEVTLTVLILQHFTFFALGGANAISSVDLSNAYNGVSGYNVLVVGILTLVSNWVGPLFWASVAPVILVHHAPSDSNTWRRHILLMTTFHALAAGFVMGACMLLRTHLFIWTVFSPKYLYTMVWTTLFHISINLLWGGVIMWAAKKPTL